MCETKAEPVGTYDDACKALNAAVLERNTVLEAENQRLQMALNEMTKIAEYAVAKWPVHKILIHHRTGILQIGEIPVIIAVSAAHRDTAFEACRYAIDTLKQTVPIWKRETWEGGSDWSVCAHEGTDPHSHDASLLTTPAPAGSGE